MMFKSSGRRSRHVGVALCVVLVAAGAAWAGGSPGAVGVSVPDGTTSRVSVSSTKTQTAPASEPLSASQLRRLPLEGTARNDVAAADARATNGRLVFTRFVRGEFDEQRNEIYTSRSDGTAVRQLTFRGENTGPQWAPFGNRIVFSRNGDIWVMGANGGHKHRLVGGPALDYEPAWAPRGRRIVFVRGLESARLVVYSLATESSRRIPGSFAHPAGPKWSPNGRQIIFAGTVANDSETPDLYTVRPGGRGLRNLTSTPRIWENGPDWSPNGHRIVYVHEGNRCRTLHVMRSDGTDDQRLPRSCPAEYPAWSPNGIKVAFNPHPEMGGRLWSMSMNGTHKMLVTRGDDPDWQPRFK